MEVRHVLGFSPSLCRLFSASSRRRFVSKQAVACRVVRRQSGQSAVRSFKVTYDVETKYYLVWYLSDVPLSKSHHTKLSFLRDAC